MSETKRILVLGGGFAGVECVRKLESYFPNENDVQISLVSVDNFFLFTPMLPQVASGTIETRHIVIPVRTLLKRTKFYEAEVKNIDPYGKTVTLSGTKEKRGISLHYDYLVLALGSQTNFFGMDQLEKLAYSMKTLNDAVVLRNRVIDMLEQADNETNPILKKSLLTFVIVGGGFAGIETAGELMDLLHDARKYYPNIEKTDIRVIVLEALPAILPGFNEKLAKFDYKLQVSNSFPVIAAFYNHQEKWKTPIFDFAPKNVFGINLSLPIFSSGQRNAAVAQKRMAFEKASNNRLYVGNTLLMQSSQYQNDLRTKLEKFQIQKKSKELSDNIYQRTLEKYKQGISSSMELMTIQNQYLNNLTNYYQGIYDVVGARTKLEKLFNINQKISK